ncbi:hypothetical protein CHRY9293_01248 [Chryseobacterium potabilaquae]|uniref:Uncharacterized protein n=1 Tax=Chryseobacterium potabilaquae TaxID=2675057 RepID=A0A6N4X632_9FLAO|nr:hypothetical protein CHRY9293_01248 [Chryseobacterium potabilaquae]
MANNIYIFCRNVLFEHLILLSHAAITNDENQIKINSIAKTIIFLFPSDNYNDSRVSLFR